MEQNAADFPTFDNNGEDLDADSMYDNDCVSFSSEVPTNSVNPIDFDSSVASSASNDSRFSHDMTLKLIELVKAKSTLLNDKCHSKKDVWATISQEIQPKGFLKGLDKTKAADKCHQRWRNLEKMYHNYRKRVNSTGKGKKKAPLYYDEIHVIIGDRHSSEPVLVLDSMKDVKSIDSMKQKTTDTINTKCSETIRKNMTRTTRNKTTDTIVPANNATSINSDSETCGYKTEDTLEQGTVFSQNKAEIESDMSDVENSTPKNVCKTKMVGTKRQSVFNDVRNSVRPKKENLTEVLKELNKKDLEVQEQSFKKLESHLKQQNDLKSRELDQRGAFLVMMQEFINQDNKAKKSKKRKHSSDESD